MAQIQDFQGMQYSRDSVDAQDYAYFNQQYATSSHQKDHDMYPDLIVQPKNDEDVQKAVNWARQKNVAVAVKSGGHQYSGASSTGGKNIQIDLTYTYKDLMVYRPRGIAEDRALVYAGVSNQLQEFRAYLEHNKLFVPHGQCAFVCLGGHGQTGGYGQLGRSFGLFGDCIRAIRMVAHDGTIQEVRKETNPERFYAILGGSPGNFGIITHYTIEVFRAQSYMGTVAGLHNIKGPYGLKGLWVYSKDVLQKLLTVVAEMSEDDKVPQGVDFCVSVLSMSFPVVSLFPSLNKPSLMQEIQDKIKKSFESKFFDWLEGHFPAVIVVYAQWCPVNKNDKYDATVDKWFQKVWALDDFKDYKTLHIDEFKNDTDMSVMTGKWIFPKRREFDLPYVKRTYATASKTLNKDRWANAVAERIDLIYNPKHLLDNNEGDKRYEVFNHCKLSVQIQCFGGANSRFYLNKDNGTSYSWRDSTVVQTLDCFHDEGDEYKKYALEWQSKNDATFVGPSSPFSKQDRRVLWGSYGDWDMSKENIWKCYYETAEKYQKLGKIRGQADPNGTFTANPFAVTAIRTGSAKL